MKVSREQAALNRERVVEVAAKLFREKGFDGIGVADLMKGAGLTHGGFYGQFGSKEDLLVEACGKALEGSLAGWSRLAVGTPREQLGKIVGSYLSPAHRANPGKGCSMTTLAADAPRVGPAVRQTLTQGARAQIGMLTELHGKLDPDAAPDEQRRRAIAAYAGMVGAMMLARAVEDEALSDEILETVKAALGAG